MLPNHLSNLGKYASFFSGHTTGPGLGSRSGLAGTSASRLGLAATSRLALGTAAAVVASPLSVFALHKGSTSSPIGKQNARKHDKGSQQQ